MTALLDVDDWLRSIETEYLGDFIRRGGAAVKFAVPCDGADGETVRAALLSLAERRGFVVAEVLSSITKIHLIDRLFAAVAAQIPWSELTRRVMADLCQENGLQVPDGGNGVQAHQLAEHNNVDDDYVRMTMERAIGNRVFKERTLAKDFRIAMTWLCRAQLRGGDEGSTIESVITAWLRGESNAGLLREYSIFTKVNRSTARHVFGSLLSWVRQAGRPGTVIVLDIARLAVQRRPSDGLLYYTKAALIDAYELLRQLIDDTDEMNGLLFCVIADEGLLDTEMGGRGLGGYAALMNRVYDDVRDRQLVNPVGSLVRLGVGGAR